MSEQTSSFWLNCRVCNEPLKNDGKHGRRPETCGGADSECARKWAVARRRAQRAKAGALSHLDRALAHVVEIAPEAHKGIATDYNWLQKNDPKDLAILLERDLWK